MTGIARIDLWTCVVPIARPLEIARRRIEGRRYLLVRIVRDDGVEGVAAGLSRGEPGHELLRGLAPGLVGRAAEPETAWELLGAAPDRRLATRVLGLADVALWDARARSEGTPLYRALGGEAAAVPLIVYGGFEPDLETELAGYAAWGARAVKLARFPGTPEEEAARLARARSALGEDRGLVYDAGWTWSSVEEAEPFARAYEPCRLLWLEDPFPPGSGALLAELKRRTSQPLGAGDEWSEPAHYEEALRAGALDVVRIDATVGGGVTGFLRTAELARRAGLPTSAHMHDYIHVHLQAATGGNWAELVLPGSEIDPLDRLIRTTAAPRDGTLSPPEAPGLGVEVDWEAVEAHAVERSSTP